MLLIKMNQLLQTQIQSNTKGLWELKRKHSESLRTWIFLHNLRLVPTSKATKNLVQYGSAWLLQKRSVNTFYGLFNFDSYANCWVSDLWISVYRKASARLPQLSSSYLRVKWVSYSYFLLWVLVGWSFSVLEWLNEHAMHEVIVYLADVSLKNSVSVYLLLYGQKSKLYFQCICHIISFLFLINYHPHWQMTILVSDIFVIFILIFLIYLLIKHRLL